MSPSRTSRSSEPPPELPGRAVSVSVTAVRVLRVRCTPSYGVRSGSAPALLVLAAAGGALARWRARGTSRGDRLRGRLGRDEYAGRRRRRGSVGVGAVGVGLVLLRLAGPVRTAASARTL